MNGAETNINVTQDDGRIIIQTTQNVAPYIEAAKREQAQAPRTFQRKRWMEKICTIPNVLIEHFWNTERLNYHGNRDHRRKIINRIMTDPAYKYLRVSRHRPLSKPIPKRLESEANWEAVGALRAAKETADGVRKLKSGIIV